MLQFQVEKFGFRIRTRSGGMVDHLSIHATDESGAEIKLRKMYPDCQILEVWNEHSRLAAQPTSYEEIIDLIAPGKDD